MRHPALSPLLAAALAAATLALPVGSSAAREPDGSRAGEPRGRPAQERDRPGGTPLSWEQEAERRVTPRERPQPPDARERDDRGPPAAGGRPGLPPPGQRVQRLPRGAQHVREGTDTYWFANGVWYAPRIGGYAVVRPPAGLVVAALPEFRTIARVGGLTLYLVNGVYYRPLAAGGYQVVEPPAPSGVPGPRPTVVPRQGQGPQQQARDEYECHRWAVGQSGHDPSLPGSGTLAQRHDYRDAQAACLDARGYTVR